MLIVVLLALLALLRLASDRPEDEGALEGETTQSYAVQETTEEAAADAVVRVSGTEGTAYQGTYGTLEGVQTAEGTVGTEPTDYGVTSEGVEETVVTAVFRKPRVDDEGTLRVQILQKGQVVAEGETASEFGEVNVDWPLREEPAENDTTLSRKG